MFTPCACTPNCQDHAIISAMTEEGAAYHIRVPFEHRHTSLGWGDRPRTMVNGIPVVKVSEGKRGIRAIDETGKEYQLDHGSFQTWRPETRKPEIRKPEAEDPRKKTGRKLKKAADLKAGQRWITVHGNGEGEKGVPVLIQQMKDGTHKVVAGAGGKLTHLRLTGIKSKEEYEAGKQAKKEKAKTEDAKRTPEQRKEVKETKKAVVEKKRQAERAFVERVRSKLGGVSEDHQDAEGASEAVNKRLAGQHHRKQVREAKKRAKEAMKALVAEKVGQEHMEAVKERVRKESPEVLEHVQVMIREELSDQEAEAAIHKEIRAARKTRAAGAADPEAQVKAVEYAREAVKKAPPGLDKTLEALGGRSDSGEVLRLAVVPANEAKRRSLQSLQDAQVLHEALTSGPPADEKKRAIVEQAIGAAKPGTEEAQDAIKAALISKVHESEREELKSRKLDQIEREKGEVAAERALQAMDAAQVIARETKEAKRLGLANEEKAPLNEPEAAEMMDIVQDLQNLKAQTRALRSIVKSAEKGDFDRSRRAFALEVKPAGKDAALSIEEEAQRALTEQLLGAAKDTRPEYLQGLTAGHYDALADVGLAIGGQRYLDRPTVDEIGAKNAAILLRHGLEQDGHDMEAVQQAVEGAHVEGVTKQAAAALETARSYAPGLLHEVNDSTDAATAAADLDAHEHEIVSAQKALSSAIGRLEGTATLGQALRTRMPDELKVQSTSLESARVTAHSLGLHPEDYQIDSKTNVLTIPRKSWDKLLSKDPREDIDARRVVHEIKAGQHDIQGWLPPGIAFREASTFTAPVPDSPRVWEPMDFDKPLDEAIKDHVGARLANGEHIGEIYSDILSESVAKAAPNPKEYRDAIERHFPLYREGGKERLQEAIRTLGPRPENDTEAEAWDKAAIKAERAEKVGLTHHAEKWQEWAQDYMERKHPGQGTFHTQDIHPEDRASREAIFRTLAEYPAGKVAFRPSGELTPQEEGFIRDHFYQRMGIDPKVRVDEARFRREIAQASMPENAWETFVKEHGGKDASDAQAKARAMEHLGQKVKNEEYYQSLTKPWDKSEGSSAIPEPEDVRKRRQFLTRELATLGKEPDRGDREANQKWQEARDKIYDRADVESGQEVLDDVTPEYRAWKKRRDAVLAKYPREGMDAAIAGLDKSDPEYESKVEAIKQAAATAPTAWGRYVNLHGSRQLALEALQDEMKGEFVRRYREQHGKVTGGALRVGVQDVTNRERHVRATGSPEEIAKYHYEQQSTMAHLQDRTEDRSGFAKEGKGAVKAKFTQYLEQEEIDKANQLSMFGTATANAADIPEKKIEPKTGQRWALGQRAESQIGSVINSGMGRQFNPEQPIRLFGGLNMDGDRIHQQRVLRQLDRVKRMAALLGTGSGKSLISIAGFTQAHAKGEATHGLYLVPAAVQDQFGGEMLRYTEPGKYSWDTGRGKSHVERVRMLKDPSVQMRVMTHQAFRDTALKLMADHHKRSGEQMAKDLDKADPKTRARWLREAFDAHGIPRHFVYYDEAHTATSPEDTSASQLHNVASAVTHPDNATHLLLGTATPTKNNLGEMYSWASMLDPTKYADRWKFLRNYGQETAWNPNAIRQELGHRVYTARIDPEGVDRLDSNNPRIEEREVQTGERLGPVYEKQTVKVPGKPVELHPEQQAKVAALEAAYAQAKAAQERGTIDIESLKVISPKAFEGKSEEEQRKIGKRIQASIGFSVQAALERVVNRSPAGQNAKLDALSAVVQHDLKTPWTDRKGKTHDRKASIIFSDSAADGRLIHEHLKKLGVRAVQYHGTMSTEAKEAVRNGFQPETGEPIYDVIVSTAAGEAGINLPRASVIHHYDVPKTEKSHAQRTGRAYRQGQLGDVEVHNWHADTPFERNALARLNGKRDTAAIFQTPLGQMDDSGVRMRYLQSIARKNQAAA